jgi:nitroimidazol reductase NimA-like FMN-containing flavoprotein (pyridoxamine 5'-phosphate oxidase superfamily)
MTTPVTELDARYSEPEASAVGWADAAERLAAAELSWISTVRPDGRPHVTPLIAVWHDDAIWFTTGPTSARPGTLPIIPRWS